MGQTTLTVDAEVKPQLEAHRHPEHDNWTDVIESLCARTPTIEDIQEGCSNCGDRPPNDPPEEGGGAVQWFSHTLPERDGSITNAQYFCDEECFMEFQEEVDAHFPETPDEVVVGGVEELQTSFSDARFLIDGDVQSLHVDVPGAFSGDDGAGGEYDYLGEPVYIRNAGKWVQDFVIEEILHEDATTSLLLGYGWATTKANHPSEQVREEFFRSHGRCPDCRKWQMVSEDAYECECGAEIDPGKFDLVVCSACEMPQRLHQGKVHDDPCYECGETKDWR